MATVLYTHDTVPTEEPPRFDASTVVEFVDVTGTFIDTSDNSGANAELPVAGSLAAIPNIVDVANVAAATGTHVVADRDTHIAGKNPTVVSSYSGIVPDWYDYSAIEKWQGKDNDPILPTAGFTVEKLLRWTEIIPAHGYMVWNGHANPLSRLYHIYPTVLRALMANPSFELCNKGSEPSMLEAILGLMVESYSAALMSTGESLGRTESYKARGKKRVFTLGIALDFCEGNTSVDHAIGGLEVWSIVDAGASVRVPNYLGSGMSSDQHMVQRKINAGVHFCTTADVKRVNGFRA